MRTPQRLCLVTGCNVLSERSYCPTHRPAIAYNEARGTRHDRGYGAAWEKLRYAILLRDPVCKSCADAGHRRPPDT